jgi:NADH:ubiquinone oxidoreductase subunit E/ferredoxin
MLEISTVDVLVLAAAAPFPPVITALLFLFGLGLAASIILGIASKIFYVWEDPRIAKVESELAGANCGGCGYPGCAACAAAIVAGKADITACMVGGNECAQAVGKVLGKEVVLKEPEVASPHCCGRVRATDKYIYEGADDCRAQMLLYGGNKDCPYSCLGLGTCVRACPFDALRMGPQGVPIVNPDKCRACGVCAEVCPRDAIFIISDSARAPYLADISIEDEKKVRAIKCIIENQRGKLGGILAILEEIQAKYGYLSADSLKVVSQETGQSLENLFGVATFFKAFSITPRGKHLVSVCVGTACHVRGAPVIVSKFEDVLGIKAGETTQDREFTMETVNCLGACALGPIVTVDGHYFSNVKKTDVEHIIEKTRAGLDKVEVTTDERIFPVEVRCPRCGHSLMDEKNPVDGHPSIHVNISAARGRGALRLSSLYGSNSLKSEVPVPDAEVVKFFCPHCREELAGPTVCPDCGAPMVLMAMDEDVVLQICSRRGCKEHILDLSEVKV